MRYLMRFIIVFLCLNNLFIKDVFIKDCIPMDDVFEKHMLDRLNIYKEHIIYDKLPILFTGLSNKPIISMDTKQTW